MDGGCIFNLLNCLVFVLYAPNTKSTLFEMLIVVIGPNIFPQAESFPDINPILLSLFPTRPITYSLLIVPNLLLEIRLQ